jgi:hypothetical protein
MAAMPPDEPFVEVTLSLREDEREALERLASQLGLSPAATLRKALSTELFLQGLLSEGAVILYRQRDGTSGEIAF